MWRAVAVGGRGRKVEEIERKATEEVGRDLVIREGDDVAEVDAGGKGAV